MVSFLEVWGWRVALVMLTPTYRFWLRRTCCHATESAALFLWVSLPVSAPGEWMQDMLGLPLQWPWPITEINSAFAPS